MTDVHVVTVIRTNHNDEVVASQVCSSYQKAIDFATKYVPLGGITVEIEGYIIDGKQTYYEGYVVRDGKLRCTYSDHSEEE